MIWHHAFWLGRVFRDIRQDMQITRVLGQQVGMFRHVGKIKFHLSKVLETRGCHILLLLFEFGVFRFYGTHKHTVLQ